MMRAMMRDHWRVGDAVRIWNGSIDYVMGQTDDSALIVMDERGKVRTHRTAPWRSDRLMFEGRGPIVGPRRWGGGDG